jgi:hypothetical protein
MYSNPENSEVSCAADNVTVLAKFSGPPTNENNTPLLAPGADEPWMCAAAKLPVSPVHESE